MDRNEQSSNEEKNRKAQSDDSDEIKKKEKKDTKTFPQQNNITNPEINKIESKSKKSADSKSEKGNMSISKLIDIENINREIEEIKKLTQDLKEENELIPKKIESAIDEDKKIYNFFESFDINEAEIINAKMNDKIFEKKIIEKFALLYNLKGFDYLPYLKLSDNFENQTINFIYIVLSGGDKQKEKEYCFLDDKKIFTVNYEDKEIGKLFFIIEKEKKIENGEDMFSILAFNENKFGVPKLFSKIKDRWEVLFYQDDFKETKIKLFYDRQNILSKINDYREKKAKKEENSLNEIITDKDTSFKGLKASLLKINQEIEKSDEKEKHDNNIVIKLYRDQRELDGFYTNPMDITIKSRAGNKIIPKNSYILVEAKNHDKLQDLVKNMHNKATLLGKIGIPEEKMFFVGIFNSKSFNPQTVSENNFIIMCPDDLHVKIDEKYFNERLEDKKERAEIRDKIALTMSKIESIDNTMKTMKNDIIDEIKNFIRNYQH